MNDKIAKRRQLALRPFQVDLNHNDKNTEVKITSPEYLSKDIIDENYFKTFSLLLRFQYVLGSSRLDARNRFATPPTTAQRAYSIFFILLVAFSNYKMANEYMHLMKNTVLRYLGISTLALLFFSYTFNILHVRFINNEGNVEFYVKMQKVDRLLKIDRWTLFNEWVRRLNNVSIGVLILIFSGLLTLAYVENGLSSLPILGPACSMLVLLLELTCCTSITAFFVLRIRFINCLIENHLIQESDATPPAKDFMSRSYLKYYVQKTDHHYETSDTHIYLRELFKCFALYQGLYRFQLLIFCLQSVAASVVTFELLLYSIQNNSPVQLLEISAYIVFSVMDVCGAVFISMRYELFFDEVKETKRLSINLMAKHHYGPLREKARKMLKMIDETPPRFSIYEMWEMNAATFVSMFALTTSLVVTALQFEFL